MDRDRVVQSRSYQVIVFSQIYVAVASRLFSCSRVRVIALILLTFAMQSRRAYL
jgi:hypothetical protein